jgi:dihydrofolate reductase
MTGKLIASAFVTLDGVMASPDKWQFPNDLFEEGMGEEFTRAAESVDAFVFGRVTYEEWAAFWPTQSADDPFAKLFNETPKYVVSRTLKPPLAWQPSTLVTGDLGTEVARLKERHARGLLIGGSAQLVSGLTSLGLIDEYQLQIHPIVVGRGKRLFKEDVVPTLLEVAGTKTYGTGVISVTYRRKGKAVIAS